ncbi:MAG: tetratricopeptide repeat protein, partial [Planctomycetaceae bacterium]
AEQNRPEEAAREFTQALELRPDFPELHANLSHVYEQLGRLNVAVASAERAVELNPDFAAGWNNLGIALRSAHRIEDAIAAFRKAVALSPDFALAEFNLGSTHLLAGNYAEGWPLYARRVESLGAASRETVVPRWQGERLEGQSLLVCADQGFGDAIQFARFLKQAKDRSGATIVFECQPKLRELMTTCAGADVVIAARDPLPSIDAHIPLAVLPSILRIDSTQLSEHVPYLQSQDRPPGKLANLAERSRKLIGLVWQGNPKQQRDAVRSCPLRKLIPVLETPGALFVSLQVDDPGHRQLVELFPSGLPENLIDAREELHGFAETAALLAQLDLVITVDTSTAHLAGALGLPVWTMLCHTPDWRWHLDRNDSPWYPTMRLFRQPAWGNWDAVAEEICTNLRRIL